MWLNDHPKGLEVDIQAKITSILTSFTNTSKISSSSWTREDAPTLAVISVICLYPWNPQKYATITQQCVIKGRDIIVSGTAIQPDHWQRWIIQVPQHIFVVQQWWLSNSGVQSQKSAKYMNESVAHYGMGGSRYKIYNMFFIAILQSVHLFVSDPWVVDTHIL